MRVPMISCDGRRRRRRRRRRRSNNNYFFVCLLVVYYFVTILSSHAWIVRPQQHHQYPLLYRSRTITPPVLVLYLAAAAGRRRRGPIRRGGRVLIEQKQQETSSPSPETEEVEESIIIDHQQRNNNATTTCDSDAAHQEEEASTNNTTDPTLLTQIQFADDNNNDEFNIHASTRRALVERLKLKQMTAIQAASWHPIREGKSVLGRSKTGTGKTLAFLIPIIERLVNNDDVENYSSSSTSNIQRGGGGRVSSSSSSSSIGCLIVAPTRELAIQIADEAEALVSFHRGVDVYCMYGGTKIRRDVMNLSRKSKTKMPTILVATPGRLVDHLVGQKTRIRQGRLFSEFLKNTPVVVLDEADRLVESFNREVKQILSFLPRPGNEGGGNNNKRQTILFSATLPKRLEKQFQSILPEDYVRVDCVGERQQQSLSAPSSINNNSSNNNNNNIAATTLQQQVNIGVDQSHVVLPSMDLYVPALIQLVRLYTTVDVPPDSTSTTNTGGNNIKNNKMVVFFPTAKLVRFFVNIFAALLVDEEDIPIFEMHSRLSQSARGRTRSKFIQAKRGVLLTSDVSARGVDYPDVDLVVQYGLPFSGEQYLHRLGRTARMGKVGQGLLVLLPFEAENNRPAGIVNQLGLTENLKAKQAISDDDDAIRKIMEPIQSLISSGQFTLTSSCESAFLSFIAYYVEYADKSVSGNNIQEAASALACAAGLQNLPSLSDTLAKRLAQR